jgi:hypothetical protein
MKMRRLCRSMTSRDACSQRRAAVPYAFLTDSRSQGRGGRVQVRARRLKIKKLPVEQAKWFLIKRRNHVCVGSISEKIVYYHAIITEISTLFVDFWLILRRNNDFCFQDQVC